jgi:hypothetical protein
LVWFENTNIESKTSHELPLDEVNGNSKDLLNNKDEEMDNHAKETIGKLDMMKNPIAVEHSTEKIERYLGGFLFSNVGMDNDEPRALDYFDQKKGQFTKTRYGLKGEKTTIAKENSKSKKRKEINDPGSTSEVEPVMMDVDEHGIPPPGINPF